jgi:hypothetical protein
MVVQQMHRCIQLFGCGISQFPQGNATWPMQDSEYVKPSWFLTGKLAIISLNGHAHTCGNLSFLYY